MKQSGWLKVTGVLSGYSLALFLLAVIIRQLGWLELNISSANLIHWDAHWYYEIVKDGYQFKEDAPADSAFFPFFPLVWYLTGFSAMWVSIFNYFLFLLGSILLTKFLRIDIKLILLGISFPSMVFFYVPYSEALFYLFAVLMTIGIHKSNNILTFLGILFVSVSRPSFIFFIPSFAIITVLGTGTLVSKIKKLGVVYLLPCFLGLAVVIYAQWLQTGKWFAYFINQSTYWDRSFRPPRFPFISLEGTELLWMEAISFWLGLLTFILMLYLAYLFFKKREIKYSSLALFSLSYLCMSFLSIVFFNPYWEVKNSILSGINRYMFATPFLIILLHHSDKMIPIFRKHLLKIIGLSALVWLMVGGDYLEPKQFIYFFFVTIYLFLHLYLFISKNIYLYISVLIMNMLGQLFLLDKFLNNSWIG